MVPFNVNGAPNQLVAKRYFEGLQMGERIPWHAWAVPLAAWGTLCLLIIFAFLCLATILRAQWSDNERLSFPLAQPALELVREGEGGSLVRNKLLWTGFAIPVVIYSLNGLNAWFPSLPVIPVWLWLGQFFQNPPWNMIYGLRAYISFACIGLTSCCPAKS